VKTARKEKGKVVMHAHFVIRVVLNLCFIIKTKDFGLNSACVLCVSRHREASLAWPDPFSRRALSIRDDKRPREKGLLQFQYQTRSVAPSLGSG